MKTIIERLKSPVSIMAIAALIFFVVKTWGGYEIPEFDKFITLIIAAGGAIGVLNNPENKTGF